MSEIELSAKNSGGTVGLTPQQREEFYRLAEELGSGRMTIPDLMRLAAYRLAPRS